MVLLSKVSTKILQLPQTLVSRRRERMQKKLKRMLIALCILQLYQSYIIAQADVERDIELGQVPPAILNILTHEKQGIKLVAAEKVYKETLVMYEIEGLYNNKRVEIQVSPEGEILKIKNDYCVGDTD